METNKPSGLIVGVLFLVATVFYMIGQLIHGPITASPGYFEAAFTNRMTVISGLLVELIGVLAIPLIAIYVFPVLKPFNYGFSIAYVVFRSIEALLLVGVSIFALSLIPISEEFLNSGRTGAQDFQTIGVLVQSLSYWTFIFAVGVVFPITALILNAVLYSARLVPPFISIWGFLAALLLISGTVLNMFDVFADSSASVLEAVLTLPIAVNEMVLALWLIKKGFNPVGLTYELVGDVQA